MDPKFAAVISSVMCFAQIHRQLAILLIVPEMMLSLSLSLSLSPCKREELI
jgi:hypothetical protein